MSRLKLYDIVKCRNPNCRDGQVLQIGRGDLNDFEQCGVCGGAEYEYIPTHLGRVVARTLKITLLALVIVGISYWILRD